MYELWRCAGWDYAEELPVEPVALAGRAETIEEAAALYRRERAGPGVLVLIDDAATRARCGLILPSLPGLGVDGVEVERPNIRVPLELLERPVRLLSVLVG